MYQVLLINLHLLINVWLGKISFLNKESYLSFDFSSRSMNTNETVATNDPRKNINFDELQQYYLSIQNKHVEAKKQRYRHAPTVDV